MNGTKAQRWQWALEKINEGVVEIRELGEEWERWRESIPENLDDSPLAERLDEVIDIVAGIDDLGYSLEEWFELELPRVGMK